MLENKGPPADSPPVTRSRLDPTERRAQLLQHAISAFAEAGIERAAHADVAARAQVSTPTVFKYFPTRDALVDAVLSEVEQAFESLPSYIPDGETFTPADLVKFMSFILSATCSERPDLMKVSLAWSVAFSPVRARYLSFENRVQDIISSVLDPETSDKSDALIVFATAKLYIRMHFDTTTRDVRDDFVDRMSRIFETAPASMP